MNPGEYARMHALEDWYWWFVARRHAAATFVRDYAPDCPTLNILDAGCGTGGMLDLLEKWPGARCIGLDVSADALEFSRGREQRRLIAGDLTQLPLADHAFEVVTALDVLEHVGDDNRAAAEIFRVLRPGGILVASVPAYRFLWGPHDEALHHQRRYGGAEFQRLLTGAGFRVEKQTFLLSLLFPAAAVARLASRRRPKDAEGGSAALPMLPGPINRALIGLQALELSVARRLSLPFGLSILAVARKPEPIHVRPSLAAEDALIAPAVAPSG